MEAYTIITSCITTGLCSLFFGWGGFIGSIIGQLVYHLWLRGVLFG